MRLLREVAHYVTDKTHVKNVELSQYITTDNMLPNRRGFTECEKLPEANTVTAYTKDDTLVSNIRPYFKKIWYANRSGGCSNDVLVFRINDINSCVSKFLYYVLSQDKFFNYMMAGANGTKMPRGNKKEILDFEIPCPPLEVQQKIASILSAYDDLIENNRRQIKLLEEAAQRLYKEWFVDLRFPGHENVKIIDGVPEGWRKEKLGELLNIVRGKSYSSAELSKNDGILMINLSNIRSYGGYNREQEKRFIGKYNELQKISPHDLIMGITDMTQERRTVGRVALVPNLHKDAIISMDLIKLMPKKGSALFYYAMIFYGGYSEIISRFANGTNVLHLRPDVLNIVDVILPNFEIQEEFVKRYSTIQNKIDILQDSIILSIETRDRLLPKLMSGEIEV